MATMETDEPNYISAVKHIILVLSGKGGVGKSTVSTQLCIGLKNSGYKVGLLDIDLCGPSIPKMFNIDNNDVHQCDEGWIPVFVDQEQMIGVMSIAFLLSSKDDPVVWRGPKKNAMIKQFLTDVVWKDLDYLIIDTPPGTSDEHITVVENLKQYNPDGAVLVTTPQGVAIGDVRREITFCKKTGVKVIGLVENMSGFVCPHCSECTNIFSKGGGEALAQQSSVPYLGSIPLDPQLTKCTEEGKSFIDAYEKSATKDSVSSIVEQIIKNTKMLLDQ